MITLFRGGHVYVVLEYPLEGDAYLHGVFSKQEYALDKADKLRTRHRKHGHIAVLKQRLKGAETV